MGGHMAVKGVCVRAWANIGRGLGSLTGASRALVKVLQAGGQVPTTMSLAVVNRGDSTVGPAVGSLLLHAAGALRRGELVAVELSVCLLAAGKSNLPRCPAAGKSAVKRKSDRLSG